MLADDSPFDPSLFLELIPSDNPALGEAIVREIWQTFRQTVQTKHPEIEAAIKTQRIEQLLPPLHQLKGSSATIGFVHLAESFREWESLAKQGVFPEPTWADRLQTQIEEADQALENWIANALSSPPCS